MPPWRERTGWAMRAFEARPQGRPAGLPLHPAPMAGTAVPTTTKVAHQSNTVRRRSGMAGMLLADSLAERDTRPHETDLRPQAKNTPSTNIAGRKVGCG